MNRLDLKIRRTGLVLALAALLLATTAVAADAPKDAREVVDRFAQSIGAEKMLEKTSMTVHGKFSIPGQGLEGTLMAQAKAPDHMLMSIEIPGYGHVRSGYGEGVGWSIDPAMGSQLLTDTALAQLADQANYYALLYRDEDYKSLELMGEKEFAGQKCWHVEVITKSGLPAQHYFSAETGLLVGIEAEQHTPMGAIPTTSIISQYEEFDGVMVATHTEQTMMGMQQVMTVEKVDFAELDDAIFAMPAEIQALSQ